MTIEQFILAFIWAAIPYTEREEDVLPSHKVYIDWLYEDWWTFELRTGEGVVIGPKVK